MREAPTHAFRSPIFFLAFIAFIFLCAMAVRIVIGPCILALVLAYVLNPFIEKLERRGVARSYIVFGVLLSACVVFLLAMWFLAPLFIDQLESLIHALPSFRKYIEGQWLPKIDSFFSSISGPQPTAVSRINLADVFGPMFDKPSQVLLDHLGQSTRFVASWLVAGIISPVLAFFVMRDYRALLYRLMNLVPPDLRGTFVRYLKDADHTLRAVLRGQLLVLAILSTLYSTAFIISGLPAALAVGIITGMARLVPYLDIAVGGSLCFLILATSGAPLNVVVAVIVSFASIQLFDGIFLTPRVMGQFSGLHPFLIILAVLSFGDWFGFYGVLLAIPMAALGRVTLLTLINLYKRSRFFTNRSEEPA